MIAVSGLLYSCASRFRRPESIEAKMARYKSKIGQVNSVPEMPVINEQWNIGNRAPASIGPLEQNQRVNYSNKKMYFFTLWMQYKTLKTIAKADNAPTVNSCPKFHTSLVGEDWDSNISAISVNNINWKNVQQQDISYFPEMHLSVTRKHQEPKVKDQFKDLNHNDEYNTVVNKALKTHMAKMYLELQELCEHGSSYNYYAFENLFTHSNKNDLMANNKSMERLLKTSIFSNHLLIEGLRTSKSKNKYDMMIHEINNRIGGQWVKAYFEYFKSKRSEKLSKLK